MQKALVLLMAAGLAIALTAGEALARDYYGAIFYSQKTGAQGYSYNYPSRAAAEQAAYYECASRGTGCKFATWFSNACGALAVGQDGGWGTGWHTSPAGANYKALHNCNNYSFNCRVIRTVCTKRPQY